MGGKGSGGARRGAGTKPRAASLSLPATIAALREELATRPADVRIRTARAALEHLEQAQELAHVADAHGALVGQWNALFDAARNAGVIVSSLDGVVWRWQRGEKQGSAGNPGAALLAALE